MQAKSIEKSSAVFKRTINRASRQKSGVDNVNKPFKQLLKTNLNI